MSEGKKRTKRPPFWSKYSLRGGVLFIYSILLLASLVFALYTTSNTYQDGLNKTVEQYVNVTFFATWPNYGNPQNLTLFYRLKKSGPNPSEMRHYQFTDNFLDTVYNTVSIINRSDFLKFNNSYATYNSSGDSGPRSVSQPDADINAFLNVTGGVSNMTAQNNSLTITAWVNYTQYADEGTVKRYLFYVAKSDSIGSDELFVFLRQISPTKRTIGYGVREADGNIVQATDSGLNFSYSTNFTFIAYVLNSTHVSVYVDSILFANLAFDGTLNEDIDDDLFFLGRPDASTGNNRIFTGAADELRLWNTALPQETINQIYDNGLFLSAVTNVNISIQSTPSPPQHEKSGNLYPFTYVSFQSDALDPAWGYGNCSCSNCSLSNNLCSVPMNFAFNVSNEVLVQNVSVGYMFGLAECNATYPTQMINFSYFDQDTDAAISPTVNYDLTFEGPFTQSVNGTFSTASQNQICTIYTEHDQILNGTISGEMFLTLDTYASKQFDLPVTNLVSGVPIQQDIPMILLNQSSTISFTWLTTEYTQIDGTMEVYECAGDGTKTLIDASPIIDGEAIANLELLNTLYSYQLLIDGTRYTDSTTFSKCHVESSTERVYYVNVGQVNIKPFVGLYSIGCNLTKPSNFTARMEWGSNPFDTSTITACIQGYRTVFSGTSKVYENCTTTGNSLTVAIPDNGLDYMVTGKLFQSGYSIQCDQALDFSSNKTTAQQFGLTGVFGIILLIVSLILIYSDAGWKADVAAMIGLVLVWILGITNFSWVTISAMLAFLATIVWIGRQIK